MRRATAATQRTSRGSYLRLRRATGLARGEVEQRSQDEEEGHHGVLAEKGGLSLGVVRP